MKKYIGNIISIGTIVLSILVMILYAITLSNTTSALSETVFYILMAIAIITVIASNILNAFKETLLIISSGMILASLGIFLNSQLSNIGYYAHGVYDIGDGILPSFIIGMILGIIALVANITSVFIKPNNIVDLTKNTKSKGDFHEKI